MKRTARPPWGSSKSEAGFGRGQVILFREGLRSIAQFNPNGDYFPLTSFACTVPLVQTQPQIRVVALEEGCQAADQPQVGLLSSRTAQLDQIWRKHIQSPAWVGILGKTSALARRQRWPIKSALEALEIRGRRKGAFRS